MGILGSQEYGLGSRTPQQIVQDLYEGILGRAPDPMGAQQWGGMLPGGLGDVVGGILGSPEYQGMMGGGTSAGGGGATNNGQFLFRNEGNLGGMTPSLTDPKGFLSSLYQGLLGRQGDVEGMGAWQRAMQGGLSPMGAISGFLGSPEYGAANRTPQNIVGGLYQSLLGRAPEAQGAGAWSSMLPSGLGNVAQGIWESPEAQQRWGSLSGL